MDAKTKAHVAKVKVIKTEVRALLKAEVAEVRALVREQQQRRVRDNEERRVRAYDNERLSTLLKGALGFYGDGGGAGIILEDDARLLRKHGYNVDEILAHEREFNKKVYALIRELHPVVLRRTPPKNSTSAAKLDQPSGAGS